MPVFEATHTQEMNPFPVRLGTNEFNSASICGFKESLHHCHRVTGLFYAEVVCDPHEPHPDTDPSALPFHLVP